MGRERSSTASAVRCSNRQSFRASTAPPASRPLRVAHLDQMAEIVEKHTHNHELRAELISKRDQRVIVLLGRVTHDARVQNRNSRVQESSKHASRQSGGDSPSPMNIPCMYESPNTIPPPGPCSQAPRPAGPTSWWFAGMRAPARPSSRRSPRLDQGRPEREKTPTRRCSFQVLEPDRSHAWPQAIRPAFLVSLENL